MLNSARVRPPGQLRRQLAEDYLAPRFLRAPGQGNAREQQEKKVSESVHDVSPPRLSRGSRWALMKRVTKGSAGERAIASKRPCWTIRPCRINTRRSPKNAASPRSCVTRTTVFRRD